MAGYSTSNPPILVVGAPLTAKATDAPQGMRIWVYGSVDAVATVRVAGYFTNGYALGMRKGDLVIVQDTDASPITGAICWVAAASSTSVDLSDGTTITGTNSD